MKKNIFILILYLLTKVSFSQCIQSAATGAGHSGYIDNNGTLWMWGRNLNGQLGNGTTTNSNIPIQIGNTEEWKILGSFSYNHTYAIKKDGTLWQWGTRLNPYGTESDVDAHIPTQIGTAIDWKFVSASPDHVMAIKTDGTLWGFGVNYYGQIGNNSYIKVDEPIQIGSDHDWNTVAAGGSFTAAIKTNGTLWAWGGNPYYMTINKQKTPIQIGVDNDWGQIDGGNNFLVALKTNGTLWEWGMKGYGNQISPDVVYLWPTQTNTDSDWKLIDAAMYKFYAIKDNGRLYHWGSGDAESEINDYNPLLPTPFSTDTDWETPYAGATHGMALKKDGSLWTWGTNAMGDLGNGAFETSYIPILIKDCASLPTEPQECKCECLFIKNPVHEFATIFTDTETIVNDVTIYDISGKSIFLKVENNQIYVGNLQDGIYIAEIKCNGRSYFKKFIKL